MTAHCVLVCVDSQIFSEEFPVVQSAFTEVLHLSINYTHSISILCYFILLLHCNSEGKYFTFYSTTFI